MFEDHGRTAECVPVGGFGVGALHARLDGVEGLGDDDGDESGDTAHGEGADRSEFLAGGGVALGELFEGRVGGETHRAVGGLSGGGGDESLEEAADAAFAPDDGDGVEEASEAGFGGFPVVDSVGWLVVC